MEYDIKSDVEIDKFNLDKECLTMAATYHSYADLLADAETLVSEKKDYLKVILAETNISIRERCANEGKKTTEGIITAMVDIDTNVIAARKELREAEATQLKLNAAVSSLQIKKAELDNLIRRSCNNNFVDNPAKPTREFQTELGSEQMRKNMNPVPNVSRN